MNTISDMKIPGIREMDKIEVTEVNGGSWMATLAIMSAVIYVSTTGMTLGKDLQKVITAKL